MNFTSIYRGFERVALCLAAFSAALILGMSLWISYDVITRNLFGFSSPWAFDLSEYSLVWITFLGAPWVLMQDRHVRIELLIDVLPKRIQRILGIAVCIVAIFICAVLAWRTGVAALEYYERNVMMARIWRIPRIWPYFVIPLGSSLLSFVFLLRLGLYLRESDPEAVLREKASAGQETGLTPQKDGPNGN